MFNESMPEPSKDAAGKLEVIARVGMGVGNTERELAKELERAERADRPEPTLPTPIGMMYEPDTSGPQLVSTEPTHAPETQTPEPSSTPEPSTARQGWSFKRVFSAIRGK
jgi:hypothetical protein